MKKIIIFIILFCLAAPAQGADVWGDLNVFGVISAGGTNERLTFDNGMYFDGGSLGLLLSYGVNTDITWSLDTDLNTVAGPELYSPTSDVIGIREDVQFLNDIVGPVNFTGPVDTIEQNIAANFNMAAPDNSTATGFINMGGNRFLHAYEIGFISEGNNVFIGENSGAPATMAFQAPTPQASNASLNVGLGSDTLSSLTFGSANTAIGANSLKEVTFGRNNVAIGADSLSNIVTPPENVAIGQDAGRYYGSGTSAATYIAEGVLVGYSARPSANFGTGEIVIGHEAIGHGSFTATLGSDSITDTYLKGVIHLGDATNNCTLTVQPVATACTGNTLDTGSTLTELCILCN